MKRSSRSPSRSPPRSNSGNKRNDKTRSRSRGQSPVASSEKKSRQRQPATKRLCMCEGKCQHTNGKGIEICNHCGSNSKFCFCRSYCKLHDDTKQNCCPQQCTTTHDYTPDYIILCIIASLFAMAIVSVYYKDEVYSFQMYVAQGGIAVWKRATSDHGPQPSGTRLYSIVASLTLLSVSCLFYLKSLSMNEITGVIAGFGVKLKNWLIKQCILCINCLYTR